MLIPFFNDCSLVGSNFAGSVDQLMVALVRFPTGVLSSLSENHNSKLLPADALATSYFPARGSGMPFCKTCTPSNCGGKSIVVGVLPSQSLAPSLIQALTRATQLSFSIGYLLVGSSESGIIPELPFRSVFIR